MIALGSEPHEINRDKLMPRTRIIPVGRDVFCVQRTAFLSCSYFIRRPRGVVMVDTGLDNDASGMLDAMREVGVDPASIYAILFTHWHNDHTSGASILKELSGARVYYHAAAQARLTRERTAAPWRSKLAQRLPETGFFAPFRGLLDAAPLQAIDADQLIGEGDVVEDEFLVLETPGHEDGHLSFLYQPENILFTGDAIAVANDHLTFMSRVLTSDFNHARESMLRCIELEPSAWCPGHRHPLVATEADMQAIAELRTRISSSFFWPIIGA